MNERLLQIELETLLKKSISDDYVGTIVRFIFDEVKDDIETSADTEYNEDDMKLAVGRVLIDKLEIER